MRFLSICSGIEAASQAFAPLGWEALAFAEIEPFPCALLAHHYPHTPNLGDLTRWREWPVALLVQVELLCGGTPCQAFSVAGLRQSLADARGNLTLILCELYAHINTLRAAAGLPPAILLWENVPGVLSTQDNAFGCFLAGLAGEDLPLVPPGDRWADAGYVSGPSAAAAYRILDAQYFGLAQRRKRLFLVASPDPSFDPAAVLFEFTGLRRDHPPRREQGKDLAPTLSARAKGGGGLGSDADADADADKGDQDTLGTIKPHCVAFSAKDYGADATPELCPTLRAGVHNQSHANSGNWPAIAFQPRIARNGRGHMGDLVNALQAQSGQSGKGDAAPCVAVKEASTSPLPFDTTQITSLANRSQPQPGHPCHPLAAWRVRRLTPEECELLQGFPIGYTLIPGHSTKKRKGEDLTDTIAYLITLGIPAADAAVLAHSPDGPRYKALGNSWAVPCARWIATRISEYVVRGSLRGPATARL